MRATVSCGVVVLALLVGCQPCQSIDRECLTVRTDRADRLLGDVLLATRTAYRAALDADRASCADSDAAVAALHLAWIDEVQSWRAQLKRSHLETTFAVEAEAASDDADRQEAQDRLDTELMLFDSEWEALLRSHLVNRLKQAYRADRPESEQQQAVADALLAAASAFDTLCEQLSRGHLDSGDLNVVGPEWNTYNWYLFGEATHDRITGRALDELGLSRLGSVIKERVRDPDWYETRKWIPWALRPNALYREHHHFDRGEGVEDATAFQRGHDYVRDRLSQFSEDVTIAKDLEAAYRTLGQGLHAIQDLVAHSNLTAESAFSRDEAESLLLKVVTSDVVPATDRAALKLTAYFRDAPKPGRPLGDAFAHDEHALDDRRGSAAFDRGVALASDASRWFLEEARSRVSDEAWGLLALGRPLD